MAVNSQISKQRGARPGSTQAEVNETQPLSWKVPQPGGGDRRGERRTVLPLAAQARREISPWTGGGFSVKPAPGVGRRRSKHLLSGERDPRWRKQAWKTKPVTGLARAGGGAWWLKHTGRVQSVGEAGDSRKLRDLLSFPNFK